MTPDVEEWTSLNWQLRFDEERREFPTEIRDLMYGVVYIEPLDNLLNNDSKAEFYFGGCCTNMKVYLGKWGVHTGYIIELLYNPGEYGRWPNRLDLSSYLLDGKSPITNHQVGLSCEFEQLNKFCNDMRTAITKMQIGG